MLMTRSGTIPFYARNKAARKRTGSNAGFLIKIIFRQPYGKILVRRPWQGHAPYAVLSSAQTKLAFARASLLTHPDHHEPGPHIAALQADNESALQGRCYAIKTRSTGGNVEGLCVLGKHLAFTIQAPKPDRDGYRDPSFSSLRHGTHNTQ